LVDPFRVESVEEPLVRGRCPRLRLDEPFGLPNSDMSTLLEPMIALRDILLLVINFGLPIYLVARLGWRGIIAGALCMWVTVYFSGEIQRADDPRAERFGMGVWVAVGLLFTFIYCGIIYGARQLILFARARWGRFDVTKVKYRL